MDIMKKILLLCIVISLCVAPGCQQNEIANNSSADIANNSSADIESSEPNNSLFEPGQSEQPSDSSESISQSSDTSSSSSKSTGTVSKTPNTGKKVDPKLLTGRVTNLNKRVVRININDASIIDTTTAAGRARVARDKELQTKYNCTIQYVLQQNETGNNNEIAKSVLAGKPSVDIWVQNGWSEIIPHYRSGLVQDLDALKVFDWSEYSSNIELAQFGGKHYIVGDKLDASGHGRNNTWMTYVMFYNQKLLDQYGITEDITELQNSGKWTWNKFIEIAKKFNQNVGDSNKEVRAIFEWNIMYDVILGSYNTDWVARDANGNYKFNAGSPKAQQAQNLYTSIISQGAAVLTDDARGLGSAFFQGKAAFLIQNMYQMKWGILNQATQEVKDNWGMVEIPQLNPGVENMHVITAVGPGGYSIPVGIPKANEIASFLNDWLYVEMDYATTKQSFIESFINECLNERNGDKVVATVSKLYDLCALEKDAKLYNGFTYLTTPGIGNWTVTEPQSWYYHANQIALGKEALASVVTAKQDYYDQILAKFTKPR